MVIGLTGGIGSGKSAAAHRFAQLGATVVDTDAIAHELTAPGGRAMPALRAAFGEAIATADGALDRTAMRQLAFSEPNARAKLEAILHPLIREESRLRCAQATGPYVVLVVPLLLESEDYRRRVDRVVVVDCAEETQIARVMARSGLARDEVRRIMAAQIPRTERVAAADEIIANDGSLADLVRQVDGLHANYLQAASM